MNLKTILVATTSWFLWPTLHGQQEPSPSPPECQLCGTFCAQNSIAIVPIGVNEPVCDSANSVTNLGYNGSCVTHTTECGIPWLCNILTNNTQQNISCSTADVLFNINYLDCSGTPSSVLQYTQFEYRQICCTNPRSAECSLEQVSSCSYNGMLQQYNTDLYKCLYSYEAVNNKWQQVHQCNSSLDGNNYDEYCDYLISQTYSEHGCHCKSSFLVGNDEANLNESIATWNAEKLVPQIAKLRQHGCASNVQCVSNAQNDDVFNGGLLNIDEVLYFALCQVFIPFYNLGPDTSAIDHIEKVIEYDQDKIYVTLASSRNDEYAQGLTMNVLVVFFEEEERNELWEEWSTTSDWFGSNTELNQVLTNNVSQILHFYGAEAYYPREPSNNKDKSMVAAIILAVSLGLALGILSVIRLKHTST